MKEIYYRGIKIFEFNDDKIIQIIGYNKYLIRIITEIYYKIFTGYRFSDIDIEAMNGYYPEVKENGKVLKKNDILVIKISDIEDILEQLTIKKNSALMQYILSLGNNLLISKSLENIDKSLIELSILMDKLIEDRILTEELYIKAEVININLDKIIKTFMDINFINQYEERIPLWLLDNHQSVELFINIVRLILESGKEIKIIMDKMDSKMDIKSYNILTKELLNLTEKYYNLGIWIIPASIEGVLLDYKVFDNTYIINEEIIQLRDFEVTYESICRNYPSNNTPTKEEVIVSLMKLFPFHKEEKEYLFTKEVIIMSIYLRLLGMKDKVKVKETRLSRLEYNFLVESVRQ